MLTRRDFLGHSSASIALAPAFWSRAASFTEPGPDAPILVVVELNGGNDGLNTIVPYADDIYQKSRPTLRVDPSKVLKLDDHVGLHPSMKELHALWGDGRLSVVQGVGYPNPNRSHFRSMEIWQTADTGPASPSGWLGRAADSTPGLQLCHVGLNSVPVAIQGRKTAAQSLGSIDDYLLSPGAELPTLPAVPDGSTLAEIRDRFSSSSSLAQRLDQLRGGAPHESDSQSLAGRLTTIRRLIEAGTPYRVYYTSLDGFDTHSNQQFSHGNLLEQLSQALGSFLADLKSARLDDQVLVLVYSEFGRRLSENASAGTDHGSAAPVLLAGPSVQAGLVGPPPDLKTLDETGDPLFSLDFRDLYASVLRQWLRTDPIPILGDRPTDLRII